MNELLLKLAGARSSRHLEDIYLIKQMAPSFITELNGFSALSNSFSKDNVNSQPQYPVKTVSKKTIIC